MRSLLLAIVSFPLWSVVASADSCDRDDDDAVALLQPLMPLHLASRRDRANENLDRFPSLSDMPSELSKSYADQALHKMSIADGSYLNVDEQKQWETSVSALPQTANNIDHIASSLPRSASREDKAQEIDHRTHVSSNESLAKQLPRFNSDDMPDLEMVSQASRIHAAGSNAALIRNITTRPNAGSGPDQIWFGILVKDFFGADVEHATFTVDVIISLKWKDLRAATSVPSHLDNLTLSGSEAENMIWIPKVEVTDCDVGGSDLISSSVLVSKSGWVHRVERRIERVKHFFTLDKYPYDKQKLSINIASTRYLSNEVTLIPSSDASLSGVDGKLFHGSSFHLKRWQAQSVDERDGMLQKSRGELVMDVERRSSAYVNSQLMPSIFALLLSCTPFLLPLGVTLVKARLFISASTVVGFMQLLIHSTESTPKGIRATWNTIFNENELLLIFLFLGLNVYIEYLAHVWSFNELASQTNYECRILCPCLAAAVLLWLVLAASHDFAPQYVVDIIAKLLMSLVMISYAFYVNRRKNEAHAALERQMAKEQQDVYKTKSMKEQSSLRSLTCCSFRSPGGDDSPL